MMRVTTVLAIVLICAAAPRALGGITVSSFQTVAGTIAYAPLDQSAYFDKQTLTNISPAVANVSDDWTGANIGGTMTTWHWVGSAHDAMTTVINSSSLSITGAGSFSYDLTTTAGFVDPTKVSTLYAPGSGANYECVFTIDGPMGYTATGRLNAYCSVELASFTTGPIFEQDNFGAMPVSLSVNGTIAPGQYQLSAGSGLGPPTGLPNGINHQSGSGGFDTFSFAVQVPEPTCAFFALSIATSTRRRRSAKRA